MRAIIIALTLLFCVPAKAQSQFTSIDASTTALLGMPACLRWCSIGICTWLVIRPLPLTPVLRTTLRIRHSWPDLVVSTWTSGGSAGNPYLEAAGIYGAATFALGQAQFPGPFPLDGGNARPKDRSAVSSQDQSSAEQQWQLDTR